MSDEKNQGYANMDQDHMLPTLEHASLQVHAYPRKRLYLEPTC